MLSYLILSILGRELMDKPEMASKEMDLVLR